MTARHTARTAAAWSQRCSPISTPIRPIPDAGQRSEAAAAELVDDLGRRLAARGVGLTDAVAQFVVARRPFLTELGAIGRRRTLDPAHLASLYEDASAVLDRLLLRFIAAHEAGTA